MNVSTVAGKWSVHCLDGRPALAIEIVGGDRVSLRPCVGGPLCVVLVFKARDVSENCRGAAAKDECLCDRIEDYLDAGDLPRQCLGRQHALAVQTIATARERDVENHRPITCLEPAPDAAPSKSQVAAAAQGTATPRE